MKYCLGIDGGGTKTKFCLGDETGRVLAESVQPTCHYMQAGFDGLTAVLKSGTAAVCTAAGVQKDEIARAFFGCPGYMEIPADMPRIRAAVAAALEPISHRVGNDAENALAGALGGAAGINIVAGTGSIAFGKNEAGKTMRCGGWHQAIGSDEGSGYWLGVQLLKEFTRQSDGRDKKTALHQRVRETLSLESDFDVIQRVVNDFALDRTKIASLAPLVAALFDGGDPYAAKILCAAAKELSEIVTAVHDGLRFSGAVPVSYTGGVFNMGERILSPMRAILEPAGMRLVPPQFAPDRGALILAAQEGAIAAQQPSSGR